MKAVIDIGNSNVKSGFLSSDDRLERTAIYNTSEFKHHLAELLDESITAIAVGISGKNEIAELITTRFRGSAISLFPVSADGPLPFTNEYGRGQAGVDRLANVAAAVAERHRPAVIVDAGTAITTEVIDNEGVFKGGAIMPGLRLQARALQQGTARLPEVSAGTEPLTIGNTTQAAIEAGLIHGTIGAVRNLVLQSLAELNDPAECPVILTGGDGPMLARQLKLPNVQEDANLTLRGLIILARHQYPGLF